MKNSPAPLQRGVGLFGRGQFKIMRLIRSWESECVKRMVLDYFVNFLPTFDTGTVKPRGQGEHEFCVASQFIWADRGRA